VRKANADLAPEPKDSGERTCTAKNYMTILAWLVIGLIAGFLASRLVNRRQGVLADLTLGICGALVGGYLLAILRGTPVAGFNIYSVLTATAGAALILFIDHRIRRAFGDRSI
jgi:uncharacterized membrane protein YeaQ/YmgE (transglycosylase-associated protein family)